MSGGDYTLTEAVRAAIIKELSQIHTCLPGRIETYDYTVQQASVTPLIKKRFKNGDILSMPIIENVPVVWPRGGGASLTFPLVQGDGVLLVFSERSMDNWLSVGDEAEPGGPAMFDLSDAIAVPGLNPFSVESLAASEDSIQIIYNDAFISIDTEGAITVDNGSGSVSIASDGVIDIDNGSGTISIDGSGQVNINSGNLTVDA